eukprot:767574-Hanusia_phi.AAC.5
MGNSGVSVSSYSSKDTLPHPPQVETVRARASGALGRNWNFVVVREILDDRMAAVLGEIEQGGIRRQCWGTATVEEHGIAALQVATKQVRRRKREGRRERGMGRRIESRRKRRRCTCHGVI